MTCWTCSLILSQQTLAGFCWKGKQTNVFILIFNLSNSIFLLLQIATCQNDYGAMTHGDRLPNANCPSPHLSL